MDWAAAHREGMLAAFQAQADLGLDTFERVDVFEAMASDDLRLFFRALSTAAALYVPAPFGGPAGAIVNALHPLAMQRYSAAHEYGHHLLGHGEQIDRESEPRVTRATLPAEEKLAEAFAAWFLMPPEAAESALERIGCARLSSAVDAYALALRLGTSYQATCTHLPSLKLVHGQTAESWRNVSLKAVKQELSPDAPPGGWRHDVWLLTERDAARPLVVRSGDRLLLELPGREVAALPAGATAAPVPATDLLSGPPRWSVDLSPEMGAGPAPLEMCDASSTLRFPLVVERPRIGRYIARRRVMA